jgi:hypothetical protein
VPRSKTGTLDARTVCAVPDLLDLHLVAFSIPCVQPEARESEQPTTTDWTARIAQPIAMVASVAVFALMFANNFGTTESSTDACLAGAIIYWGLAPGWSRYRDKTAFVDWATAYSVAVLVVLLAASLVTAWTWTRMQSVPPGDGIRIGAVTGSFALVLAVLVGARLVWSHYSSRASA